MKIVSMGYVLGAMLCAMLSFIGAGAAAQSFEIANTPTGYHTLRLEAAGQFVDLSPAALRSVMLQDDPVPGLLLDFRSQTATIIASMTARALGQPMNISVCGEIVMQPVVQETIGDGRVLISEAFTEAELTTIAEQKPGAVACAAPTAGASGK